MATYLDDRNQRVTLDKAIKSGGEGSVHSVVGLPDKVAKIYHLQKLKDDRELAEKLRVMVANPPADPMRPYGHISIAWPESRLTSNGQFAGYLMPRIRQPNEVIEFYSPATRSSQHPNVTWKTLHSIARNLAAALAAVHARKYVVGDLNESNIFVNDVGLVTLIDTDSFQVHDLLTGRLFRCKVGKGAFTPAELQGLDLKLVDRQPHHDLFGLGVLLFHLLMEGNHPFTGITQSRTSASGSTVFERNIGQGNFPYVPGGSFSPPPAAPEFNILHPQLQAMFRRCFLDGHRTPSVRPTANEWHGIIQMAEASLMQCRANSKHWYARHLTECPWCLREKKLAGRGRVGGAVVAAQSLRAAGPPQVAVPLPTAAPPPRPKPAPPQLQPPRARLNPVALLFILVLLSGGYFGLRAGG